MRLIKVSLRNFRGVLDATVPFGDGVTVVAGPNEAGKSSIAEALRLIREMKSSSRHRDINAIKPVDRDVGPKAEVELRTGKYHLTYRKRWLKDQLTELTVHAPAPEQLSGDEAHERYLAILADTVDVDLLVAMEVVQGESLAQPELAKITSLQRALDDSSDDNASHDTLMERIDEEYERFFTKTGRETGEYRKSKEQLEALEIKVESLQDRSAKMDQLNEEHRQYTEVFTELTERMAKAKTDLKAQETETQKLKELRDALEKSTQGLAEANRQLDQEEVARSKRTEQATDLEARAMAITEQSARIDMLLRERNEAKNLLESAQQEVSVKEKARADARASAKAANSALERHRDQTEHDELSARVKRAREAGKQRSKAAATLDGSQIDDETIKELVELDTEVRVAESARTAAAATVSVQALGAQPVTINGEELSSIDIYDAVALDTVTIGVEGVLSVDVRPGTPPADLERSAKQAQETFAEALRAAEVESIDGARLFVEARNLAQSEHDQAKSALEHILEDSTLEAFEDRLAAAAARLSVETEDVDTSDDFATIETTAKEAATAAEEAEVQLEVAQAELEKHRESAESSRENWVRATETLKVTQEEHDKLAERLAQDREAQDDTSLETAVKQAEEAVSEWQTQADADQTKLDAADPDTLDMLLRNAQQLVESTDEDRDSARTRVDELGALLEDRASQGIYNLLSDAEAALEAAQSSLQRQDRSANAVKLLRVIMVQKREVAQQRYVAPFKERIERLGTVVFGKSFEVQVSKDLKIESRTLDGRTIPFESLSAGAREQVSLLGRLASAQLVDATEGAPVILDDTLGFADPERLKSINVVLNDVGQSAQVILLTCQPQRFENLGGAKTVRLQS